MISPGAKLLDRVITVSLLFVPEQALCSLRRSNHKR